MKLAGSGISGGGGRCRGMLPSTGPSGEDLFARLLAAARSLRLRACDVSAYRIQTQARPSCPLPLHYTPHCHTQQTGRALTKARSSVCLGHISRMERDPFETLSALSKSLGLGDAEPAAASQSSSASFGSQLQKCIMPAALCAGRSVPEAIAAAGYPHDARLQKWMLVSGASGLKNRSHSYHHWMQQKVGSRDGPQIERSWPRPRDGPFWTWTTSCQLRDALRPPLSPPGGECCIESRCRRADRPATA